MVGWAMASGKGRLLDAKEMVQTAFVPKTQGDTTAQLWSDGILGLPDEAVGSAACAQCLGRVAGAEQNYVADLCVNRMGAAQTFWHF